MQYVPAAQHSQALIAWLNRYVRTAPYLAAAHDHVHRLRGNHVAYGQNDQGDSLYEPCVFGGKRTHAMWLREHIASEPMSLLHGVVL